MTPHARQLSNRTNMPLNDYRGIAKAMAIEGVPVRTELIWGLPGDTLADFKGNLDELLGVFPDVAIYAYALLSGTEFFDRREEYRIRTERVHPVADVAADYVVSRLSCSRSETLEGYVLLSAHSVLNEGRVIPLTSRYLALRQELSPSDLLLTVIRALVEAFPEATDGATAEDDMAIFECRFQILRLLLDHREETFGVIRNAVASHFDKLTKSSTCAERVTKVIDLDEALCAPLGAWEKRRVPFTFHAHGVQQLLAVMQVPHDELFEQASDVLECTFLPWGRAGAMVRLVV